MQPAAGSTPSAAVESDVVVIGSGSGGGVAALEIVRTGLSVALVEQGRFGGECHYVACVPSKALLIAARAGATWADALRRREVAVDERNDAAAVREYEKAGIRLIRGRAVISDVRTVSVIGDRGDPTVLSWSRGLVLAPGSEPVIHEVPGLTSAMTWTSEQALSSFDLPAALLVMGGGAVGCELAQIYAAFGSKLTIVEKADRLLATEQPWVGETVADNLRAAGLTVLTGTEATSAQQAEDAMIVELSDGSRWTGDRVLMAGGRTPRTDGIGLERLGITLGDKAEIPVDSRCHVLIDGRAAADVFAVGDVTATAPFTHTANAQARTVAGELTRSGRDVQLAASPRAVYTDPTVWCVGMTEAAAHEAGLQVRTAAIDISQVERGTLEGLTGRFELIADQQGTVLGAAAVGPGADGWATTAQLAVQLRLPVDVLGDALFAFPTLAEAVGLAARALVR